MPKIIKKILILGCISILTIILAIFFLAIRNSNVLTTIYCDSKEALINWGVNTEQILFEFQDENFTIIVDDNQNIKSARKDFLFWVRNHFTSSSLETMHVAQINDNIYLYGATSQKNINEIKLTDLFLNEYKTIFLGKWIEELDRFCYCLKIPNTTHLPFSTAIVFVDDDNNIMLDQSRKKGLLFPLLEQIDPSKQTFSQEDLSDVSLSLSETYTHQFYIALNEEGTYTLQEWTEGITVYFLEESVLLLDRKECLTRESSDTHSDYFNTTYQLDYDDNLFRLKEIAKEKQNKDS